MPEKPLTDVFFSDILNSPSYAQVDAGQILQLVKVQPGPKDFDYGYSVFGNDSWVRLKEVYQVDLSSPALKFHIVDDSAAYYPTRVENLYVFLRHDKEGLLMDRKFVKFGKGGWKNFVKMHK